MSLLARALCVAFLLTGLGGVPAAQAASDDWRLLYADGELRDGTGALRSKIPANISIDFPAARFSPDGTRLAAPGTASCGETCGAGEGALRIYRPDGTSFVRGAIPNFFARAMAWSPDGSTVAAMGPWRTPEDDDVRIYLIPVDGGEPTQVYSDTRLLRISDFAGLSWNPVDDRIAFVATEVLDEDQGFIRIENTDQVWTVPATANGVPSRYTGRPECQGCAFFPYFRQPTWSPDGSRLLVGSSGPPGEFGEPAPAFIGYLAPGATGATTLIDTPDRNQRAFSADGGLVAFGGPDTSGDGYGDTTVVDADTGDVVEVVEGAIAPFTDWLPCPGGTCQVWQDVYVPPTPFMNLSGVARRSKVVVSGELGRVPEVANVTVTLHKRARAGARWRPVTSVDVEAVEGLFKRSFPRPRAVQCRARGVYEDGTSRATDTVVFRC